MSHSRFSLVVLIALLAAWLPACGDGTSTTNGGGSATAVQGGDSPEDVMAKAKAYAENKDFGGIVNLIAPAERPMLSAAMIMMSQMAPMMMGAMGGLGGEEGAAEMKSKMKPFEDAMKKAMEKHGADELDLSQAMANMQDPDAAAKWINDAVPGLDHGAFVGDVFQALSMLGDKATEEAGGNFNELAGELKDLKIDGDKATATINDKPGEFVKVDGRWYLSIKGQMK